MHKRIAVFAGVLLLANLAAPTAYSRDQKNLYDDLKRRSQIRVFLTDVTDISGQARIEPDALKQKLGDALSARKSLSFVTVESADQADLIIACEVAEFFFTEQDPIDNLAGLAGIALDAMVEENYARTQAVFTVRDAAKDKVVWERKLKATLTDAGMNEEESVDWIADRLVKVFIKECFSRGRSK